MCRTLKQAHRKAAAVFQAIDINNEKQCFKDHAITDAVAYEHSPVHPEITGADLHLRHGFVASRHA